MATGQTEPTTNPASADAAREPRRNDVRAALVRMHAATVLFGISGIFGKLCQCSAVVLVCGRALFAVAALGCLCLLRRDPPWRGLSRRDMQATREVGAAIEGIQSGTTQNVEYVNQTVATIEQTTGLAGDSGTALSEIVVLVEQAADQAHSIAAAAEEQSATSDEINRAVDQINTISAETSSAMFPSSTIPASLNSKM